MTRCLGESVISLKSRLCLSMSKSRKEPCARGSRLSVAVAKNESLDTIG